MVGASHLIGHRSSKTFGDNSPFYLALLGYLPDLADSAGGFRCVMSGN